MDIELLQQLIDELSFSASSLRTGIVCEVPRTVVNDVFVGLASGSIDGWALSSTIPADKCLVISVDIVGNGTGHIMDTGKIYLKVSDRLLIEPYKTRV